MLPILLIIIVDILIIIIIIVVIVNDESESHQVVIMPLSVLCGVDNCQQIIIMAETETLI